MYVDDALDSCETVESAQQSVIVPYCIKVSGVPSEGDDNSSARAYGCHPFKLTSPEHPESDHRGQNHLMD